MSISRRAVRIKIDTAKPLQRWVDAYTNKDPQIWRGSSYQFEFGVFNGQNIVSLDNVDAFVVQVKALNEMVGVPIMSATASPTAISSAAWATGASQVTVTFDNTATNIPIHGEDTLYWMVAGVITDTGEAITLGATNLMVKEDGWVHGLPATNGGFDLWCMDDGLYYRVSVSLIDGLPYLNVVQSGSPSGMGQLAMLCADDGRYYNVRVRLQDGSAVLEIV